MNRSLPIAFLSLLVAIGTAFGLGEDQGSPYGRLELDRPACQPLDRPRLRITGRAAGDQLALGGPARREVKIELPAIGEVGRRAREGHGGPRADEADRVGQQRLADADAIRRRRGPNFYGLSSAPQSRAFTREPDAI